MGENDVSDVTAGAPETPDAGTRREEGVEIVPVSKVEETGEKQGLAHCPDDVSVHVAPSPRFVVGWGRLWGPEDGFPVFVGEGREGSVVEGGGLGGGGGGIGGVGEGALVWVHLEQGKHPKRASPLRFASVCHTVMAQVSHHPLARLRTHPPQTLERDIFGDGSELSSEEEGTCSPSPLPPRPLIPPQTSPSTASAQNPPSSRTSLSPPKSPAMPMNRNVPPSRNA